MGKVLIPGIASSELELTNDISIIAKCISKKKPRTKPTNQKHYLRNKHFESLIHIKSTDLSWNSVVLYLCEGYDRDSLLTPQASILIHSYSDMAPCDSKTKICSLVYIPSLYKNKCFKIDHSHPLAVYLKAR